MKRHYNQAEKYEHVNTQIESIKKKYFDEKLQAAQKIQDQNFTLHTNFLKDFQSFTSKNDTKNEVAPE